VIYVDGVNGNDANDGHRIINPKKTIKNAVAAAAAGDIIKVAPGVYQESLPIDITVANLSIVGEAQRSCFVHPTVATQEQIMFRCNSGTYIDGFTFAGLKASGARGGHPIDTNATYGLPTNQGWVAGFYPGCSIKKSPYINNCTNFADSGIDNSAFDPNNYAGTGGDLTSAPAGGGIIVDGSVPSVSSPLRSFVVNEFTQVCLDGPGLLVCNNGYAQAVSFFGLFCHYHAKALSGGQINMEVGTTDFGRYGLIADGKSSSAIFTATANGAASASATTFAINAPTAGGTWFGEATRPAINMLVQIGSDIYPILSSTANGAGWNVVISRPNPANRAQNLGLINSHANGAAVSFFLRSMISTASHTMEYAGSGTDYNALPENGGVANETNESVNLNNGRVWLTSTDQSGKFKVGDTFAVDQQTGFVTIDPQSVATNIVSDLSPELGGDLDVLTRNIYSSVGPIKFNTSSTERVRIDSSGRLLVGTSSTPLSSTTSIVNVVGSVRTVTTNANAIIIQRPGDVWTANDYNDLLWQGVTGGGVDRPWGRIRTQVTASSGSGGPTFMSFHTNADAADTTERLRIDSSGRLLVGTTTTAGFQAGARHIFMDGGGASYSSVSIGNIGGAANTTDLNITAWGGGGNSYATSKLRQNGSDGSLSFHTQATNSVDGAGTTTERMRIDSSGKLLVGTTSSTALGFNSHYGALPSGSTDALNLFSAQSFDNLGAGNPVLLRLNAGIGGTPTGRLFEAYTSNGSVARYYITAEYSGSQIRSDKPFVSTEYGDTWTSANAGRSIHVLHNVSSINGSLFDGVNSLCAYSTTLKSTWSGSSPSNRNATGYEAVIAANNSSAISTAFYADVTGASSNWGVYVNNGKSYFKDQVLIGTSSGSTAKLQVNHNATDQYGIYVPGGIYTGTGFAGNNYGGYFSSNTSNSGTNYAIGVYGTIASGPANVGYGGFFDGGAAPSNSRIGVYGTARQSDLNGSGQAIGGSFNANTSGSATGTLGSTVAVLAENTSTLGSSSVGVQVSTVAGATTVYGLQYVHAGSVVFRVKSNGGIDNFSGNNTNLSDIREKKNIKNLEGTWDCLKNWDLKEFHFNTQKDSENKHYGVIAQQIETVCPEVVSEFEVVPAIAPKQSNDGTILEEGTPAVMRKSIKEQQMMWMAIKALQEAQLRIETLEAEVTALKGQ
jgi:hypothetical protein